MSEKKIQIKVRVTEKEKKLLLEKVEKKKISMSEFIRNSLISEKKVNSKDEVKFILNRSFDDIKNDLSNKIASMSREVESVKNENTFYTNIELNLSSTKSFKLYDFIEIKNQIKINTLYLVSKIIDDNNLELINLYTDKKHDFSLKKYNSLILSVKRKQLKNHDELTVKEDKNENIQKNGKKIYTPKEGCWSVSTIKNIEDGNYIVFERDFDTYKFDRYTYIIEEKKGKVNKTYEVIERKSENGKSKIKDIETGEILIVDLIFLWKIIKDVYK